jgi:hypothetical protein
VEYVATELNERGTVANGTALKKVSIRGEATEMDRQDAVALQIRAEKQWPNFDWQIEKGYAGKYVVRAYSEISCGTT